MNYRQAQKYLESFVNYENTGYSSRSSPFKLGRIKSFLKILHNPQEGNRFLHVAGTKGKGTTCAFLAYILSQAGFEVGLYTSPHLATPRERIRILRKDSQGDFSGMIPSKDVAKYVTRLRPVIERFKKSSRYGNLTLFEVYTVLAFLYFKEEQVDFVVLETGLGGRLDATNAASSLVAGITPVSYEHTQILGKTLAKIAVEKSGIIKNKGQIVVCAPQSKEAKRVIEARCRKVKTKMFSVGQEIKYARIKADTLSQTFKVKSIFSEYLVLKSRLLGRHQMANAALAIGMVEALRFNDIFISAAAVKKGIAQTRWPGRFEFISRHPAVILDGAQNVASAQVLKDTLKEVFGNKKVILVLGISQDKDLRGICRNLENIAKEIIITAADSIRATPPAILKTFFSSKKKISLTSNVGEAMSLAFDKAQKSDLILVTGSLFVVGEARGICLN
ncbi:MAG: folylpolyglutamate synthase/dihydrofolate synthase family protein [Candidatus Omnitrophota bacterium]|nr:folylpolyglutamate synthase/dihydrofolate synthase family protein [Candidatus Omnitrophota bacterium]